VSVRVGDNKIITTGTGTHLGFLTIEELVAIDMSGRKLWGALDPSSEVRMHICAYSVRPDIGAVVHAHPPLATAFSVAGVSLAKCVLPEVVLTLGSIPTSAYATPTTEEVPEAVRDLVKKYDALLLSHHGTLTLGATLFQAYMRLEKVEHTAQVTLAALQLGRVRLLPPAEVEKLARLREGKGMKPMHPLCEGCEVAGCELHPEHLTRPCSEAGGVFEEELVEMICREVRKEAGR